MDSVRYSAGHFEPVAQMRRLAKIPLERFQGTGTGFVPVILKLPSNPSSRADDELLKLHLMTDANLDLDDELAKLDAEANGLDEYDVIESANEKQSVRTSYAKRSANSVKSKRTANSDKTSVQSSSLAKYYKERKLKSLIDIVNKPSRRTGKQHVKDKELKQEQDAQDSSVSGHSCVSQMSGHNMRAVPRSVSECDTDSVSSATISELPGLSPSGERIQLKETRKQPSANRNHSPLSNDLINRKSKERQRKALAVETEQPEKALVNKNRKSTEQKVEKEAVDSNNSGTSRLSRMSGRNMRAVPRNDSRRDSDTLSLLESDPGSIISVSVIRRSASPVPPPHGDGIDTKETRKRLNSLQSDTPATRDRDLVEQMKEERRRERERLKDRDRALVVINNMHKDISGHRRVPTNDVNKKSTHRQPRAGANSVDGFGYDKRERYGTAGRGKVRPIPVDTREMKEIGRPRPYSAKAPSAQSMNELLSEMSVKDRENVLLALKDELKLYRGVRR